MNKLILGVMMVAVLVACSAPASAIDDPVAIDQLNRYEEVVPHGGYWLDWDKIGAATTTFNIPAVDLYKVRIYNSAWMPPDVVSATWPNSSSPLPLRYPHTGPYSRYTGCGTTGIWYGDESGVTDLTIPGEVNTFWTNGNGHGVAVHILYQDDDNPNPIDSWFYQGYDDSEGYGGCDGYAHCMTYTFNNVTATNHTHWTLMVAVTCADDGNIVFNNIALPNGYPASGKWYHVATNDVSGMVLNGINVVKLRTDDGYFHPYWMWLVGYTPPQQKADLIVVGDPVIDPVTPRPDKNFTVNATILNQGDAGTGVQFDASLWINGSFYSKVEDVGPLVADDSTLVSFKNVNLGEGCHNFTVIADCDDEVDELDELNNESNDVDWQVGYVIVVESDSDFERLNNTPGGVGDSPLPAGCFVHESDGSYTIKNLTITNCAGDGISIEGTTKNFVINNCTVYNCTGGSSGVFLNNVTKGTITGCTLYDNKDYGIELGLVPLDSEDPKNINITCNTIYQNGINTNKNGIDLIGTDCIVKGNTVRDNGAYGIYVYGNDNTIYNNTIENNDDYGIKLYNSSGNYVYWNDIIDNNGTGVQGWDNRVTNTWNTATQVYYPYKCDNTRSNYTGNYWNDHTSPDANGDGIVDIPYPLNGGLANDYYPLTVRWRLCGDVNRDGVVNSVDLGLLDQKVNHPPGSLCNEWAADVNRDGVVNSVDLGLLDQKVNHPPKTLNCCCEL